MNTNLPKLTEALEEIAFFEQERTDRQLDGLAILLYDCGVSLRKVARVLGWIGVERSHVAVWTWIQTFGQPLGAAVRRRLRQLSGSSPKTTVDHYRSRQNWNFRPS